MTITVEELTITTEAAKNRQAVVEIQKATD